MGKMSAKISDQTNLVLLLRQWDVPYEIESVKDGQRNLTFIKVGIGYDFPNSDNVTGYYGFYTLFEFDEAENFLRMGAWE